MTTYHHSRHPIFILSTPASIPGTQDNENPTEKSDENADAKPKQEDEAPPAEDNVVEKSTLNVDNLLPGAVHDIVEDVISRSQNASVAADDVANLSEVKNEDGKNDANISSAIVNDDISRSANPSEAGDDAANLNDANVNLNNTLNKLQNGIQDGDKNENVESNGPSMNENGDIVTGDGKVLEASEAPIVTSQNVDETADANTDVPNASVVANEDKSSKDGSRRSSKVSVNGGNIGLSQS